MKHQVVKMLGNSLAITLGVLAIALALGGCPNPSTQTPNPGSNPGSGVLDTTFNALGTGANAEVDVIAVQSDGKILIGGHFWTYNTTDVGYMARLNADGTLDTTFNAAGSGANDFVDAILVQDGGKILIGGAFTSYNDGTDHSVGRVARLNSDGSLDTTFNASGTGANWSVGAIAKQGSYIIIAGAFTAYNDGTSHTTGYIARLNANGSLDTFFNTASGTGANYVISSIVVQSDLKIVIGGQFWEYDGTGIPGYIARLTEPGQLDPSFNYGGTGAGGPVYAISALKNGVLDIGGNFNSFNTKDFGYTVRLSSQGSIAVTSTIEGTGVSDYVCATAGQSDLKTIVGGFFTAYKGLLGYSHNTGHIERLSADGTLDTTFNASGTGANGPVGRIAIQSDGKILIGGWFTIYNDGTDHPVGRLARLWN
jgi:uncharacterized delta-60 repeat protein